MLFEKKYDRAREVQRRASGLDKEEEQERRRFQPEEKLERGDWFAMLFSAFYTLFLPGVGVICLLLLIVALFFRLF